MKGKRAAFANNISVLRWIVWRVVKVLLKCAIHLSISLVRISEFLYANFSSTCVRCTHLLKSYRWLTFETLQKTLQRGTCSELHSLRSWRSQSMGDWGLVTRSRGGGDSPCDPQFQKQTANLRNQLQICQGQRADIARLSLPVCAPHLGLVWMGSLCSSALASLPHTHPLVLADTKGIPNMSTEHKDHTIFDY